MTGLIEHILSLSGWLALLIVFAVPALESSAFLGFFFPGETALILGGVLASYGRVSLWAVLVAGISGAIIGDSVGYLVGREYGRRLLETRPLRRVLKPGRIDRGQDYLATRGGRAVFFGRFTAALRVLVPGLAGMARMPYRVFLPFNVAGGAIWGTGMVLLGYLAGASWKRVAHYATQVGIALFAVVVLALDPRAPAAVGARTGQLDRAAGRPGVRQPPGPLAGSGASRRSSPGSPPASGGAIPTGFSLTVAVLTLGACGWSFGSLTNSVLHHINSARFDPQVLAFFVGHRAPWLTGLAKTLTWLGSGFVLWPVVIGAGLALWRWRRQWLPAVLPALALAGAWGWSQLTKTLVARPRPPAVDWLGTFHGWSYPSQHAAQALAAWGMLGAHGDGGPLLPGPHAAHDRRVADRPRRRAVPAVPGRALDDRCAGRWALAGVWGCLLIFPYLAAETGVLATGSSPPSAPPPRAARSARTG